VVGLYTTNYITQTIYIKRESPCASQDLFSHRYGELETALLA